jgi:hypothetical protein
MERNPSQVEIGIEVMVRQAVDRSAVAFHCPSAW